MAVPAANTGRLNSPGGNRVATVACKFYRHGKCTAGTACAFRHDSLEILHNGYYQPHMQQQQNGSYRAADVVLCKFYMKGTCKFGNRCSMAHGGGMWDTGTLRGAGDGNGFGDSTVYGVSPSSSSSVKDHYFSARWRRGSVGNNGTPYGSYGKPSQLSTSFGGDASAENVAHLISAPTAIYAGGMAGGGPTGTYPTTTSRSSASYDDDASVTANTTLSVSFRAQPLPSPDSIKHPAAPPPIRHKSMPDIFRWSADDGHAHPSGNFLFYSSSYADTHDDVDADEEDDDVLKQIPAVFEDVHDEGDADGDAANAENVRSNNGTSRARAIAITPPKQPNIRVKVVRPSVDMEPSRNDLRQSRESGGASTPDPFSPFPGDFSDQELEHEHNSFMESSEQRLRTMSLARGLLAAELQPLDGMAHVTPQRQALTDHHHAAASPYGMAVDNIPLSVEEELAHHLRDMHLRNVQLCPFAMAGKCRFGDKCRYVHGITCPTCQRDCLHPYQPETHAVHMVECQRNLERLTRSECVMCRLCGEEIFSRGKFGLLECEHAFCLVWYV